MSLSNTIKNMKDLLCCITSDLEKAENGNKAASQRVRTGTVKLEKIAKSYRKESVMTEKKSKGQKKSTKKTAAKAPAKTKAKASVKTAKVKPKAKAVKASFRPRALAFKRPTAKLPARRFSAR